MNRILWIFICILLIIVLFGVTAFSCTTYENFEDSTTEVQQPVTDAPTIELQQPVTDAPTIEPQQPVTDAPTTEPQEPNSDLTGVAFVAGPDGKMTELKPTGDLGGSPTYYEPGTYKFGSATYVPTYEDSIYLSKTTGKSTVSNYLDEASIKGGSCSYYKNQPEKLEEMCMAVDKNNCGAMSCCVLLGGSKCVSGNKQGPYNKLNYGDITVKDKDYYYYQGKCYGNCN